MEAKELRIGNYVKYEGYECYREINEISKHCIKYHDSMLMPYCEAPDKPVLVGIPLTEEWLIKFGFERVMPTENFYDNDGYAYELNYWGRIALKNGVLISDEYYFLDGLDFDIKYVHELQNLYFSLTKKELKIKK